MSYDAGLSIEELFPDDSQQDHIIQSDMWAGSKKYIESTEFCIVDGQIKSMNVSFPPALYKCYDEAVVNAIDNMVRLYNPAAEKNDDNQVTDIYIDYSADGVISVKNNGKGIPIGMHATAGMYSVQFILGNLFKGKKKTDDRVTGDANRVGIKIANALSLWFRVATCYASESERLVYTQEWRDHMRIVDPPVIRAATMRPKEVQFTKITFLPDYAGVFNQPLTPELYQLFLGLFHYRAYCAAAYVGFYSNGRTNVWFNGARIPFKSMKDLSRFMSPETSSISCVLSQNNLPWEITIAIKQNDYKNKTDYISISNVNGIVVRGGRHIKFIHDQITNYCHDELAATLLTNNIKYSAGLILSNIFIFANTQIPSTILSWDGQRKDEAKISNVKILTETYKIEAAVLKKIAAAVLNMILAEVHKPTEDESELIHSNRFPSTKKFTDAAYAGKKSAQCGLCLAEGDSAKGMIDTGMNYIDKKTNKKLIGYDYYGILTLQGVIINLRREAKFLHVTGVDGKTVSFSKKAINNTFLDKFIKVLGLDVNKTYETQEEVDTLRYGFIVVCVDQDHDGTGFIFPLVANIFDLLWPALLRRGFIKKWDTPRRRVYPPGRDVQVHELFTDYEWECFRKNTPNIEKYRCDYIKGLATHSYEACIGMFRRFEENLITYLPDEQSPESFNILFAEDTSLRKKMLSTPLIHPTAEQEQLRRKTCQDSLTNLLMYNGKEHALHNLNQKLWSAVDGMNESGRKILDGSIKYFAAGNNPIKVSVIQGYITEHEHYQHGEASLIESICGKAYIKMGGMQLPQLLPSGQLGSRAYGGKDHGSARYVKVYLNKALVSAIYNPDDYPCLDFVYEDGDRAEPVHFIPIIPMALLETVEMPASGWKIQTWGRDALITIKRIKYLINHVDLNDLPAAKIPDIPMYVGDHLGEIRYIRGVPHTFGKYIYYKKKRIIHITELPLGQWTAQYIEWLNTKMTIPYTSAKGKKDVHHIIADIQNNSGECIDIIIKLSKSTKLFNPVSYIENFADGHWVDGFEEYFGLHASIISHLSMMTAEGYVHVFDKYEDILRYWMPIRAKYYEKRIQRQKVLLEAKLVWLQNIIRYCEQYKMLNINNITEDAAIIQLAAAGYDRINSVWLKSKGQINGKFLTAEEIQQNIINGANSSYDYLFNLTDRARLSSAVLQRAAHLQKIHKKLDMITNGIGGRFYGANQWLLELTKLEQIIIAGRSTLWQFDDFDKYKY